MPIISYPGIPDDSYGTDIQDRSSVAAPHGSWGGVAPGQIGNLLLTGHRTSTGAPMRVVPSLRKGDSIQVRYADKTYIYRVTETLWINFRDPASRALQQAAVPGKPRTTPTRPAIVLSTCATPEDHANGLYWSDQHHNPTHRFAIVGYLQGP